MHPIYKEKTFLKSCKTNDQKGANPNQRHKCFCLNVGEIQKSGSIRI